MSKQQIEQTVYIISVLVVAFIVGRILRFLIGRFFKKAALKLRVDSTHYNFFKNAIDFIIFLVAGIIIFRSIPALQTFGTTLLTGAGILAAVVGFASQSAFSNIVSGVFLVIFKPFRVGDRVRIGTHAGDVEDITLRHTVIRDFENRRIVIPNSVISNETIVNSSMTDERACVFIECTLAHQAPLERALTVMQEEATKHPFLIDGRSPEEKNEGSPVVVVRVMGLTDLGVQLRAYTWAKNPNQGFDLKTDLLRALKKRFDQEGIDLAIPHRALYFRNELPQ
jgi:small conductance mechanosensitive channel